MAADHALLDGAPVDVDLDKIHVHHVADNSRRRIAIRISQLLRYSMVSLASTGISLTVLGALVATSAVTAGWANVIATASGIGPSFELNRRWVWNKRGKRSLWAEVGPFCVLSFTALGLSTWAVSATARWADQAGLSTTATTVAVLAANLAAFGSLWVLQFVVLDRVLFRHRTVPAHPDPAHPDPAHPDPAHPDPADTGDTPSDHPEPRPAAGRLRTAA